MVPEMGGLRRSSDQDGVKEAKMEFATAVVTQLRKIMLKNTRVSS